MKLFLAGLIIFCAFGVSASPIEEILKGALLKKVNGTGFIVPGERPPRYQEPGRNPYEPGYPDSRYPDSRYDRVSCVAKDRGYEEHSRGHYSCGECLREHGECIETCSTQMSECQAEGTDRRGNRVSFAGRGDTRWSAEDQAMDRCYYRADNCRIVRCDDRNDVVSRRSCR